MRVGIVIPVYNGERFLAETVQAVIAQSHSDWELVVVDNASTDGTGRIAAQFAEHDSRISVVRLVQNRRPGGGRNAGLEACGPCDAFLFLDGDDILYPDALAAMTQALEADPEALAAHGRVVVVDENGVEIRTAQALSIQERWMAAGAWRLRRLAPSEPTTLAAVATWHLPTPGAVLIRRQEALAAGGFDETDLYTADLDYWLRLARKGRFAYVDQAVLKYRRHSANLSLGVASLQGSAEACYARHLASPLTGDERKVIRRGYRGYQQLLARSKFGYAAEALKARDVKGALLQSLRGLAHLYRGMRARPGPPPPTPPAGAVDATVPSPGITDGGR